MKTFIIQEKFVGYAEITIEAAKQTANEIILNINIPFHKALL